MKAYRRVVRLREDIKICYTSILHFLRLRNHCRCLDYWSDGQVMSNPLKAERPVPQKTPTRFRRTRATAAVRSDATFDQVERSPHTCTTMFEGFFPAMTAY